MRKQDVLHLAAVAAFAICTSFAGVSSVQAVGLSGKQKAEVSEFIKCQSYLLTGNLSAFEADADCGNSRVPPEMGSLGVSSGSGGHVSECSSQGNWKSHRPGKKRPGGAYQGGMQVMSFGGHEGGGYGGGYCQHDKKPDYKQKPGKKHGKKPGKKPGGFPGGFPSFPQY